MEYTISVNVSILTDDKNENRMKQTKQQQKYPSIFGIHMPLLLLLFSHHSGYID